MGSKLTAPARLAEAHVGLVPFVLSQFMKESSGKLSADDAALLTSHTARKELLGAGYLALVRAANGFNPACGTTFSTYAIVAIRRAMIEQANRERAGLFPVSRRRSGREISRMLPRTVSLDASPDSPLANSLADDPEQRPEAVTLRRAARKALWEAVSRVLTEQEARVIVLHYGNGVSGNVPYRVEEDGKLSAIATHLGTSRQNVHETHGRALRKLRQKLPRHVAETLKVRG